MPVTIERIEPSPLSVPLREPFVIASGRVDATRAALIRVAVVDAQGLRATGLGESAALPPVTREDQPDVLAALAAAATALTGACWSSTDELSSLLDSHFSARPVARAGLECALLDALARLAGVPLCTLLTGAQPRTLSTDITLPIAAPERMAELAHAYRADGFRIFKVKVGKSLDDDLRALRLIVGQVPDARFRLDANAAFSAEEALTLLQRLREQHIAVDCFEQPCARDDLDGMAYVTAHAGVPVLADESVRTLDELARVHARRAASGVNLKLAKSGGLLAALRIGQRARALGMQVMCGGMVETRLGMTAMGHVACALGGADYVDLDTALLLANDPFEGGYVEQGAELLFGAEAGLGVRLRGA